MKQSNIPNIVLLILGIITSSTFSALAQCSVDAGPTQNLCANQSFMLQPIVLNATAPISYQWSPGTYMNAGGTNRQNPIVTPLQTTVYSVTITDALGCTATDNITINVSGAGPAILGRPDTIICAGQGVGLNFDLVPLTCGKSVEGCTGANDVDSVGAGFNVQAGNAATIISPYGNYQKSTRMQMLYRGSELQAAFGRAGTIQSVAWEVAVLNSNASLQNFTIKMGCVDPAVTTLTNWVNGLKTVKTQLYTPLPGWNNHVLDSLYDWDGISNLIVEICFYNSNTFNNLNNRMVYTNEPGSVIYSRDSTNQCSVNGAFTTSFERPKMRLTLCMPDTTLRVRWTPNTGPNAVLNDTIKSPIVRPVTTQTYYVEAWRNSGTCRGSAYVTVIVDTVTRVSAGPDISFCVGQQVQLTATTTGQPMPGKNFSFTWKTYPGNVVISNTQSTTVTPAGPATYVVLMDGGPCPKSDTVSVTVGPLSVSALGTNLTCNGVNNGKVLAIPSGQPPYTFQWSANASTGNVDSAINLAPGTYSVTVSDNLNCIGNAAVTITQPPALTFSQPNVVNATCNGYNDGRISITAGGGTPGPGGTYTYQWSSPVTSTQPIASSLTAGNYTVTIGDANNCTVSVSVTVGQPSAITFAPAIIKDVRCFQGNDGTITVVPSGGTPSTPGPTGYTYDWSPPASSSTATASNLLAGSYTVTVRDASNCSASQTNTVLQPSSGLTISSITPSPVTCFGGSNGSATVTVSGGAPPYQYLWTPSNQTGATATGLTAQQYTIVVTDDSLCTATGQITITQAPEIQVTGNITPLLCAGDSSGEIDITVTSAVQPVTYAWSHGPTSEDVTGLSAITYTVTVTDNMQCVKSASFSVNQPPALGFGQPAITPVKCLGDNTGEIIVTPTGGTGSYSYTWSPPVSNTARAQNLAAGTYWVTLSDINNCQAVDSYAVTQPATALAFGPTDSVDVLCNGAATGSITVSVTGGTGNPVFSWSHNNLLNNATASGLQAGQYTVTANDANNCSISATHSISQPPAITFGPPNVVNVSCNGGNDASAEVTPAGGVGNFTYTWNGAPGANPQTGLVATNYNVVVTDGNGCTATTSVNISEPPVLLLNPIVTNVSCFGGNDGAIDANPNGGGNAPYAFTWSNGSTTQVAGTLTQGTYFVTITDSRNCSATNAAMVNQPNQLTLNPRAQQVSCIGDVDGSIEARPNGGTPPYHVTLLQNGNVIADNYTGNFSDLPAGDYTVNVDDGNQCVATGNTTVAAPVADIFTITADSTSCYGSDYNDGAIHVNGLVIINQPFQYSLDGGNRQYSGDFYFVSAGAHTITATNQFGCSTELDIVVPEPANAYADVLPADTTIQLGETIQLFTTLTPYPASTITGYQWSPGNGLSCNDCPNPLVNTYNGRTDYTVTITYNGNCTASASINIAVDNTLDVFVPNAFTPNGDGNNDVFMVYGQGIKSIDLDVFNRWGEKVFGSNNQFNGWDGTFRSMAQNPGVYVYQLRVTYLDDKRIEKTGSVTLTR